MLTRACLKAYSNLYYKHITIANDDCKWCHNLEHHSRRVIYDPNMYFELSFTIINYKNNTFIVKIIMTRIVNYYFNMIIVRALGYFRKNDNWSFKRIAWGLFQPNGSDGKQIKTYFWVKAIWNPKMTRAQCYKTFLRPCFINVCIKLQCLPHSSVSSLV